MELNVSELIKEGPGSNKSYTFSDILVSMNHHYVSQSPMLGSNTEVSLSGTTKMLRTDSGIWVTARFKCQVICLYSRCLNLHSRQLSLKINEEYYLVTYNSNDFEIEESQFISKENILDLVPSIHDHVNLDIPLNPICREGCAGIYINCGLDLNKQ